MEDHINVLFKDDWMESVDQEIAIFQTKLIASGFVSNPKQTGNNT